jgi:trk system potassium uptake protein
LRADAATSKRRRRLLGVDLGAALNLVGAVLKYLSVAFAVPVAVALGYGESPWPFLGAAAITAGTGLALELATRGKEHVGPREGFLVVAATWLLAAVVGSLPYLLSGEDQLASPVDALFESMSGFTTTGSTVLVDVEALSRSLLIWRQLTQWLGGMGIVVLALAVLPRLRVGGRQLFESEVPGAETQPLVASIRQTARQLWALYIGLTALLALLLVGYSVTGLDPGLGLFEALAHPLTTMPTGGFSTEGRSIEAFGAVTQWTIVVFMILAGANFGLMYAAAFRGHARPLLRDQELRLYLLLMAVAAALLTAELWANAIESGEAAVRHAAFQAVAITTTTGYSSADYVTWTPLAILVLVALMFVGGSAASTGGGIKVVRHLLVGRTLWRELDQAVHPEVVASVRLNDRVVDEHTLRAVIGFVPLYLGLFAIGAITIAVDQALAGEEIAPFTAVAIAATAMGNIGPAVDFAGPMGSFEALGNASKLVMVALMWLGRLEILPVIVLFTSRYWRP